jgi:hypothetical protein
METFWQKEMKVDELTQPGWEDAAYYFHERGTMYGTSELRVPAVVKQQTDHDSEAPAQITFGRLMVCFNIIPGKYHRMRGSSRPGKIHTLIGSRKPQSNTCMPTLSTRGEPHSPLIPNAKPVEFVRSYCWILQPLLITI